MIPYTVRWLHADQVAYPTEKYNEVVLDIKRIADVAKSSRGPRTPPPTWLQWAWSKVGQKVEIIQTAVSSLLGMDRVKLMQSEWQMARQRFNRMVRLRSLTEASAGAGRTARCFLRASFIAVLARASCVNDVCTLLWPRTR